jgi:hypothetical protein
MFDPAAIRIEDQRKTLAEPEKWWQTVVRGVGLNWDQGGLPGLFGLMPEPAPVRTLSGRVYDLSPSLGMAPVPQPGSSIRQGLK